ncbi:DUF1566 domain-containing protein, partial [Candidatus Magnetaquicoccus inordinatus]|uniref:Lcl domain-containing protein n=1 Tax=Candidatus Magnetaquicoccus inordinatus TaxID=2496818 RepID=UPI00102C8B35
TNYWTSTTASFYTDKAFMVSFANAAIAVDNTLNTAHFMAVRDPVTGTTLVPKSGQIISYHTRDDGALQKGVAWPAPRFSDQGDGSVIDLLTGLTWMKNAKCWGISMSWTDALNKIADLNNDLTNKNCSVAPVYLGSKSDWRLPSRSELESLLDMGSNTTLLPPAIPPVMPALPLAHPFSNVTPVDETWPHTDDAYWSSSTAQDAQNGWTIQFSMGEIRSENKTSSYHVWPVRGGK